MRVFIPNPNLQLTNNSTSHRIESKLRRRKSEYTTEDTLYVQAGTFNSNGQVPQSDIHGWLETDNHLSNFKRPDIYVFGFQEMDLSKEAYLPYHSSQYERDWIDILTKSLINPEVEYELLKSERLVGIMIVVFVKKSLGNVGRKINFFDNIFV